MTAGQKCLNVRLIARLRGVHLLKLTCTLPMSVYITCLPIALPEPSGSAMFIISAHWKILPLPRHPLSLYIFFFSSRWKLKACGSGSSPLSLLGLSSPPSKMGVKLRTCFCLQLQGIDRKVFRPGT